MEKKELKRIAIRSIGDVVDIGYVESDKELKLDKDGVFEYYRDAIGSLKASITPTNLAVVIQYITKAEYELYELRSQVVKDGLKAQLDALRSPSKAVLPNIAMPK